MKLSFAQGAGSTRDRRQSIAQAILQYRCRVWASGRQTSDFSVLQFRLDFMRVFGRYPMKLHRNQWLVMPLHAPKVPYRTLISPQAILYEGYQPSYRQYVTCFLKGCVYNPLK